MVCFVQASTQKEIKIDKDNRSYRQSELTKELQSLLDALVSSKPIGVVIISGIKILNKTVPTDFSVVYSRSNININYDEITLFFY